eukprot:TRINITY_DN42296_c0_g1_i1.p1 TRINITY_DN42296_c0_g1~~TRINITY_DN42296_c0_g1_i1.p1  ORF type:complete len:529 (-),score=73.65 TRINITY_DN42296_c0_g1_i1:111-1697(-)
MMPGRVVFSVVAALVVTHSAGRATTPIRPNRAAGGDRDSAGFGPNQPNIANHTATRTSPSGRGGDESGVVRSVAGGAVDDNTPLAVASERKLSPSPDVENVQQPSLLAFHLPIGRPLPSSRQHSPNTNLHGVSIVRALAFIVIVCVGNGLVKLWSGRASQSQYAAAKDWLSLVGGAVGLSVAVGAAGAVREHATTRRYYDGAALVPGTYIPSSLWLDIVGETFGVVLLCVISLIRCSRPRFDVFHWCSMPAGMLFLAGWCLHVSLHCTTYLTQLAFKSATIVPTMLLTAYLNDSGFVLIDYVLGAAGTSCLFGFAWFADPVSDVRSPVERDQPEGVLVLVAFVVLMGVCACAEQRIFKLFPEFSIGDMIFGICCFYFLIDLFMVELGSEGIVCAARFMFHHPAALGHAAVIGVFATIGRFFAVFLVRHHGPTALAVASATGPVFSVVSAAVLTKQPISMESAACAVGATTLALLRPKVLELFETSQSKRVDAIEVQGAKASESSVASLPGSATTRRPSGNYGALNFSP